MHCRRSVRLTTTSNLSDTSLKKIDNLLNVVESQFQLAVAFVFAEEVGGQAARDGPGRIVRATGVSIVSVGAATRR